MIWQNCSERGNRVLKKTPSAGEHTTVTDQLLNALKVKDFAIQIDGATDGLKDAHLIC